MSFNIFQEITNLIHKTEDLSPDEKTSLSLVVQYYKEQNEEHETFADVFQYSEKEMPGISSEFKEKKGKGLAEFRQHLEDRIHHLEGEYPDLTASINQVFTTLSNMGV